MGQPPAFQGAFLKAPRKTRAKTVGNMAPCCRLLPLSVPFSPALSFRGSQDLFLMFLFL